MNQIQGDKADMNYKAQNGWTPLTLAVFHGKVDCALASRGLAMGAIGASAAPCNVR